MQYNSDLPGENASFFCAPQVPPIELQLPLPLLVRGIKRQRIPSDKGVGDTVHRILSKMGGLQFEWVMKRLGINCGCGDRQAWLNAAYPYDRDQ